MTPFANQGRIDARRRRSGRTWSRPIPTRCGALHGAAIQIIPQMSTGATDGLYFRAAGIPVYGVDGSWGISPDDERAHGLDERLPVKAFYDDVLHWEYLVKTLAGK